MADRRHFYVFLAVSAVFWIGASFAHPVTPTIIQERGFGDYMFGVALGSMMAVNFLFSPFWGKLITYVSSRKVMLICSLGYAIGQGMFGLADTETDMIVARMFAGVFTAGVFTASLTYVVNTTAEDLRGRYLTIVATTQMVAGAFGFFVGGMLGEISVAAAMISQVVVLSTCGVVFYFICRDDRAPGRQRISPFALFREANPVAAFAAGRSIMTPLLASLFVVAVLSNLGGTAFDQSFNYYLREQLGLSSGYNGAIKGVVALITLVVNGSIGMWLINKTDASRSAVFVFLVSSMTMLGVVLVDGAVPFIAINVVYFGINAISIPLIQALLVKRARGRDSNLTMGYYNGMKSLGGIAGSLAAGFLYTVHPKWPFVLGLIAYGVATAAAGYHFMQVRRERLAEAAVAAGAGAGAAGAAARATAETPV